MYLEDIRDPAQVKDLSPRELEALGQELRDLIVKVVSTNGGHLASNLGVVELTLALLANFDVARDKIVWDVGHQCYPYKILTGRRERFRTLRQFGGVNGFPNRAESAFDAFGAGHASTSISAALGFAKARDLRGEQHKVIAVIGDGALTGGMAWEAMNNAGVANTDLVVILNDNEMSISRNDSAVARHMAALRSQNVYQSLEDITERILTRVPITGKLLVKAGKALKLGVTHWISPEHGAIFEALGFEYIGPIDGHNLPLLRGVLAHVRSLKGPVLVHVVTQKGHGCEYAESDARRYHGVTPFDPDSGEMARSGKPSFSRTFGETMVELGERMPEVVAITAAMVDGTGLTPFAKRFPDRCFDVGIAEEHAVTYAAALAAGGLKPVVALYSTFVQRAYDQIVHDVCLQNLPVVFAIDRAGIVGQDGATHQGVFDISLLRHVPNLVVMAPRDGNQLRSMLLGALQSGMPCVIRYPRDGECGIYDAEIQPLEMGRAEVLRPGSDVILLGLGNTVQVCQEAAGLLEQQGVSAGVVDARFVKPLDEDLLLSLAREGKILVTVEEHVGAGGFGSAVLEALHSRGASTDHVLSIALPDQFIPHGDSDKLRAEYGCTAGAVAAKTFRFYQKRG